MKKFVVILSILFPIAVLGQQIPMYSQYLFHDYLINPAVVGTRDYYDARMSYRLQWTAIEDAPRTMVLSSNGPLKNRKMGIGGFFINDIAGHIYQKKGGLTYSYIISMTDGVKLSLGLSAGLLSFTVDGTKLNLGETGDQVLSNYSQTYYGPDGAFGFLLYSKRLRLGASINQLFGNKLSFFKDGNVGSAKLDRHYQIHGSYLIGQEDATMTFSPYLLLKYVTPTPLQFDIGVKAEYKKILWLGATYRSQEAISLLLGGTIRDNLIFGYSYDFVVSDINPSSGGSHEILLALKLRRALPPKQK